MDRAVVAQLERIKNDQSLAVNLKMQQILAVLEEKGCMYTQKIPPALLLVHSQNRSGIMINSHDAHKVGLAALKVGFQEPKLVDSLCVEVHQDQVKKQVQMSAMKSLVNASEGRLAPVTGLERFATLSSSHISQFLKAAHCGECETALEDLQPFAVESLHAAFRDDQCNKLATEGWTWRVLQHQVEEACPWTAQLLQSALNTSNSIGQSPTEIEICMNLAVHYLSCNSMGTAIQICKGVASLPYLDCIAVYVSSFGGGGEKRSPVLTFLQSVQKLLGSSLFMGEDFMSTLASVEFKSKKSTFPMCRAAFICANMASPKSQNGIAKMLFPSVLQKVKTMAQKNTLEVTENVLFLCWDQVYQQDPDFSDRDCVKVLAKPFVRAALWLTNKEGKGKEQKVYENMESIHQAFLKEVAAKAGSSSSSAMAVVPVEEEQKIWDLKEAGDVVAIAIQQYAWLVPQKLYFKKGEETFYKFEKMEADSGQFTYVDLFGKKHGVEVPHEELKMFRPTDKKAPERIDARDLATLSLQQSSAWKLELEKAEVQAAILRASMDAKPLELENFLDEEDATLSLSETKVQSWLSIPLLSNKQQLPAGSALTFYNPPLDEFKQQKNPSLSNCKQFAALQEMQLKALGLGGSEPAGDALFDGEDEEASGGEKGAEVLYKMVHLLEIIKDYVVSMRDLISRAASQYQGHPSDGAARPDSAKRQRTGDSSAEANQHKELCLLQFQCSILLQCHFNKGLVECNLNKGLVLQLVKCLVVQCYPHKSILQHQQANTLAECHLHKCHLAQLLFHQTMKE
ncbi:Uncharacterized protein SCF082_LOCUS45533 [Durusdinium trenchii]|uniref:Uncharacterized protein n=1 Tax=Durusdinium trenchii TaxID=1381693 RepID=A0ABP0R8X0_9DINO